MPAEGQLTGRVHVVDDDASFRTAIERRLKQAGYEVATYPSAQHLLDRLPSGSETGLHSSRRANTRTRAVRASGAPERTWLDIADRVSHWLSRCSDHGADHQGGLHRIFRPSPYHRTTFCRPSWRAIAHHEANARSEDQLDNGSCPHREPDAARAEVFELIIRGKTNKHVANALGTTERTIKAHRHRVMEKMQGRIAGASSSRSPSGAGILNRCARHRDNEGRAIQCKVLLSRWTLENPSSVIYEKVHRHI